VRTCCAGGLGRRDDGAGRPAHEVAGVAQHRAALAAGHLVALRRAAAGVAAAERAAIVAAGAARAWVQLVRLRRVHLCRSRQAAVVQPMLILKRSIVDPGRRQPLAPHQHSQSAQGLCDEVSYRHADILAASARTFLSSVCCAPSPEAVAATSVRPGLSVAIEVRSVVVSIRVLRRRRFHVAVGIYRGRSTGQ